MKDSQDWLNEILEELWYSGRHETPMLGRAVEDAKSAIREHFLKEALEMINNMEYDDEDFTITPVLTKLEGKFNDKYKED